MKNKDQSARLLSGRGGKPLFLGSVLEEARSTLSSRGNTTERCVVHVLKQMSKRKGSYYLIKITCNDGNMH